jgi:hypothetical protein
MRSKANKTYTLSCRHAAILLPAALVLCLSACRDKGEAAPAEAPAAGPVVSKAERGPVTVALRADAGEFSIADVVRLTCTVEAEQDVDVEMPEFGENMGGFLIKDFRRYGPEVTADNKNRRRQEYELEAYVSGEYKVPPLTVRFLDRREEFVAQKEEAGEEPQWNDLKTEEITLKATSIVEDPEQLTEVRDIMGPVSLPREAFLKHHGLLLGIAAGAGVLIAAAVWLILRKREIRKEMLPAHVIAFRMLEWLIAQDFVGEGRFEAFYVHLCAIVRRYIEMRFGIHAPEETTEEFLSQLSAGVAGERGALLAQHEALLREFLEHADLVKFARHTPGGNEIQNSFDSAKVFIQATSDETALVEAATAAAGGAV